MPGAVFAGTCTSIVVAFSSASAKLPIDLFSLHHCPASDVILILYAVAKPRFETVAETETLSPEYNVTSLVVSCTAVMPAVVFP